MMKCSFWTALLVLPLLILLIPGCKNIQSPVFQDLENFQLQNPSLKETVVSANVKYYNPNSFGMRFRHAEMTVYINNHLVGKSVLDTLIDIPKRDTFFIPVSMKVNLGDVFSNALQVLLTHEADIKLDGFARLGKGGIYINVPIRYQGKQRIDISLH